MQSIIYCSTRKSKLKKLQAATGILVNSVNISCKDLSNKERKAQNDFLFDRVKMIIATNTLVWVLINQCTLCYSL